MKYLYVVYDMKVKSVPSRATFEAWMRHTLNDFGLFVAGDTFVEFPNPPNAYTILYALRESHAVVNTAPECGWVQILVATCKEFDSRQFMASAIEFLSPEKIHASDFVTEPPK